MSEIETLLREVLTAQARNAQPSATATRDTVDAFRSRQRGRMVRRSIVGAAAVAVFLCGGGGLFLFFHQLAPRQEVATAVASGPTGSTDVATVKRDAVAIAVLSRVFKGDLADSAGSIPAGGLRLRPGSASTAGLPSGYSAAVQLSIASDTQSMEQAATRLADLCSPSATADACGQQPVDGGTTVHYQYLRPAESARGAWTTLRVYAVRVDGSLHVAEMTITPDATTNPKDDASAKTWLGDNAAKLGEAAMSPLS